MYDEEKKINIIINSKKQENVFYPKLLLMLWARMFTIANIFCL